MKKILCCALMVLFFGIGVFFGLWWSYEQHKPYMIRLGNYEAREVLKMNMSWKEVQKREKEQIEANKRNKKKENFCK